LGAIAGHLIMRAKFKINAYLPLLWILMDGLLCVKFILLARGEVFYVGLALLAGLLILIILLILIRSRIVVIWINAKDITVRRYLGLGDKKQYDIKLFDGYKIREINSEHDNFERLYLIKNGEPIIGISENYYINYREIKEKIHEKLNCLGVEPFNIYK
jgi:hypothetical protein